jgi:predicted transcriptional regulator
MVRGYLATLISSNEIFYRRKIVPVVYAVKHVMSTPLITVEIDAFIQDAVKLMVEKDIGALVVTEKGKPVGIVTERDILRKLCQGTSWGDIKVGQIMSKPLIAVDAETPIGAAVELMTTRNIRRLLVTESGKIVGIVTERDLTRGTFEILSAFQSSFSRV